ncbi:MAG: sodium/glutamate symporter [Halieaceae bacterium]
MEFNDGILHIRSFLAITIGIVALFAGRRINDQFDKLRELSIPEPVTGGLLFSLLFGVVFFAFDVAIEFELQFRDFLLVYFFTTIGINASVADLKTGGRPLLILMAITLVYMLLQNLTGLSVAALFDLPPVMGMLGGGVSLIGGHGTTVAWAPMLAEQFGLHNAMEVGIACATFGLILASLMGGPMARFLISRYQLTPETVEAPDVGVDDNAPATIITHLDYLDALLAIHLTIIFGMVLNEACEYIGFSVPMFVTCLLAGMILTNIMPKNVRRLTGTHWPSGTPAMALIADTALGTFLAMSLMSLQLWALIDLAGPLFAMLAAQFVVAIAVSFLVVFPAMGKDYNAAVICSGFGGISLGSTPTAMANMAAVTARYGASHQAFIVVSLVSAFFISVANALLIPLFLSLI